MSVLAQAYAVPSRVLGVYRYLLRARGRSEDRETLSKVLAPDSLIRRADRGATGGEEGGGRDMAQAAISECETMGLIAPDGDAVRLHPDLPPEAIDPELAEAVFPRTLAKLFFGPSREANHDLGLVVAWYLAQNAYDAPGTVRRVLEELGRQVGEERLRVTNNARYGNFEDWTCFLGFGWTHALKKGDVFESVLTPDPTAQLRLCLEELFPHGPGTRHAFPAVMARLAAACPVFEGGALRAEVERYVPRREPNHLSTATALAWLRLRDEGAVQFARESDAEALLLPDGGRTEPVSHATWCPTE